MERLRDRIVVITGAAGGIGLELSRILSSEGAKIVMADISDKGLSAADSIPGSISVRTDVTSEESVRHLINTAVDRFGGIDCFINNAGVVTAGGLDTMTPEEFDRILSINTKAYYLCVREVSRVMKLQTASRPEDYYADIIQINSKSGLRGSKANFAYSSSKFGGIGLTQSFALELAPYRIKVNSICPGNYLDGALWSDPQTGLFKQYLDAGKVPGARTVEDVRQYYLSQVPMHKPCTPADIAKAILYAIEQTGETGQAIPVTGGQVMLG